MAPSTEHFHWHNWGAASVLDGAFSTDVSRSKTSASEERRGLLDRPRRTQSCQFQSMNQTEATRLFYLLSRAADETSYVPLYSSRSVMTAAVAGAVVSCDTRWRRVHDGFRVLLHDPSTDLFEVAVIQSHTDSSITLTGAPAGSFGEGCYVYPLMDAEVLLSSALNLNTDFIGNCSVTFQELMESALPALDTYPPASFSTYGGVPILNSGDGDIGPDWGADVQLIIKREGSVLDLGRGTVAVLEGARPRIGFSFDLVEHSREDIWDALRFFEACAGRLHPFWVLNPATFYSVAAQVEVTHIDIDLFVDDDGDVIIPEFSDYIAIVETDGTTHIREIDSVVDTGTVLRVAFSTVLSSVIAAADVSRVTTAHLSRFDSDSISEEWLSDEVCRLHLVTIEVLEEDSYTITNLSDAPTSSIFAAVGSNGGPRVWWGASKNVFKDASDLAEPGDPNGDGDDVDEVFDPRVSLPTGGGKPTTTYASLQINGAGSDLVLHRPDDRTLGGGRLCVHFKAGNAQLLDVSAPVGENIEETWFDNSDGITLFAVVTDLQAALDIFSQTGVFEWSDEICKFFDALGVDNADHHVDYSTQTVRENEVVILVVRWIPSSEAKVWRNGTLLGQATTPIADFPAGGGTIQITGDDAKLFDLLGYNEALSDADLNLVANQLASLFNITWTDI